MMNKETLRRFYEASFALGPNSAEMSALDAPFDDYYEFLHKIAPAVTRRSAAQWAMRLEYRKLAEGMPPDSPHPEPLAMEVISIEKKISVDLAKTKLASTCERLDIDRVKNVRGWKSLGRLRALRHLQVSLCDSNDRAPLTPPLRLETIDVESSTLECLRTVLASVNAPDVELASESAALDLAVLATCKRLRRVFVAAPLVRGVSRLRGHPIEELKLADAPLSDQLRDTIHSLAPTLRHLRFDAGRVFSPGELGSLSKLKALRQLAVPAFLELKKEWVDFAAANPRVGFTFFPFNPPDAKREVITVAEIHHGVDILRCVKGKKVAFEVADDLASRRKGYGGSNEDLEDELRARAKAAKKKIDWRSELDTLVARTTDVETARWVVDQAASKVKP